MVVPSPTDVDSPNDIKLSSSFLNKKFPVLPIKALKVPLLAKPRWVDFNISPDKPEVLGVCTILPLASVIIFVAIEAEGPVNAPDTFASTLFILVCKALDEVFILLCKALEEAFKLADTEVALGKLPLTEAAVAKPVPPDIFTVPVTVNVEPSHFNAVPKLALPSLSK